MYTVKKVADFPVPSRNVTYQDMPAGDGKIAKFFLQCKGRLAGSGHCDGVDITLLPTKRTNKKIKKQESRSCLMHTITGQLSKSANYEYNCLRMFQF